MELWLHKWGMQGGKAPLRVQQGWVSSNFSNTSPCVQRELRGLTQNHEQFSRGGEDWKEIPCLIKEPQLHPFFSTVPAGRAAFLMIFIDFSWFSLIFDEFLIYWGWVGDLRDLNAPRQRPLMPKRMSQHAPVVPPTTQYIAQTISGTTTVPRPPPGAM